MRYKLSPLIFTLLGLSSCHQETKTDNKIKTKISIHNPKVDDNLNYRNHYKYGHVVKWTPEIFKQDSLTLIDSVFHNKIINQIEGYNWPYADKPKNYFISKQHDINGLTALTVSLYWGVCYNGISLLILDKNEKLLNTIQLTEWYSSCDLITNTETEFLNDSTFRMHYKTIESGETSLFNDIEYIGKINSFGQVDTLKILFEKTYEE